MTAIRKAQGRYTSVQSAQAPGDHLPKPGKRRHMDIAHGVVPDPYDPAKRQRVAINTRIDALEEEYKRGRISEGAYQAGRVFQMLLERSAGVSHGSTWSDGSRGDPGQANEMRIIYAIQNAQDAVKMLDDARPVIGLIGERVLVLALGERMTFAQIAGRLIGDNDPNIARHYGFLFRQYLETLAEHWRKTRMPS